MYVDVAAAIGAWRCPRQGQSRDPVGPQPPYEAAKWIDDAAPVEIVLRQQPHTGQRHRATGPPSIRASDPRRVSPQRYSSRQLSTQRPRVGRYLQSTSGADVDVSRGTCLAISAVVRGAVTISYRYAGGPAEFVGCRDGGHHDGRRRSVTEEGDMAAAANYRRGVSAATDPDPAVRLRPPLVAHLRQWVGTEQSELAVEYDGDQHRTDRATYVKDLRRAEIVERLGWINVSHRQGRSGDRRDPPEVRDAWARRENEKAWS